MRRALAVAALFASGAASAALLPPEIPGLVPRALVVANERDERIELRGLGSPSLLLPIFARCGGTCPLAAAALRDALAAAEAPFRVVLLSFDEADTGADLREFRGRLSLPPDWLLVRSVDAGATRAFFDGLGFHFMKANGGFDHPDETLVFSPRGAWAATFAGSTFRRQELETAFWRARAADDPTASQRLGAWLVRPEAWVLLACAGLALSAVALAVLPRRASR